MQKEVQALYNELKVSPDRTLRISYFDGNKQKSAERLSLLQIEHQKGGLEEYLKSFSRFFNAQEIVTQVYKPNGSSVIKVGIEQKFKFSLKNSSLVERNNESETVGQTLMTHSAVVPTVSNHYSTPASSSQNNANFNYGLGMVDIINMKTDQERLRIATDEIDRYKSRVQQLETEKHQLQTENNTLKAENLLAGQKLELELLKKDNENKPVFSETTANTISEVLKTLAPMVLSKGATAGMNAPEAPEKELSQNKQALLNSLKSQELTEAMAGNLMLYAYVMQNHIETSEKIGVVLQEYQQKYL